MSDKKKKVITARDVREFVRKEYKGKDSVKKKLFKQGWEGKLDKHLGFEHIKKQPSYQAGKKAREMTQRTYMEEKKKD